MTELTSAQYNLLTQASTAGAGDVDSTPSTRSIATALIKRGLMISIPQKEGPSRLLITEAGRTAIGVPPSVTSPPRQRASPAPGARAATPPQGKIHILLELLKRPDGATIGALMEATGWQAHSVRGALTGAIKKALGLAVISEKTGAGRVYRIATEVGA